MKRIFSLLGFTYLVSLFFLNYIPKDIYNYFILGILIILISLLFFLKKYIKENKPIIFSIVVFIIASTVNINNYNKNILSIQNLNDKDKFIIGKVIDIPYKKNNQYNYILSVDSIDNEKVNPFKIKLTASETLELESYDTFKGKVHFYLPENSSYFDFKNYYMSKNIYILAFAYNYLNYDVTPNVEFDFFHQILNLRQKILSVPNQFFDKELASVMNSFLLGEKHNLSNQIKTNFDKIGIYHLISTSGIHISILSQFCFYILKKLKLHKNILSISICLILFLFMALAGFTPAVTRAGIIAIIYYFGMIFFRKPDSLNSLGFAVLLMLIINQNLAINIGFLLSISSTLGIIILEKPIRCYILSKLKFKYKILKYFICIISVSIAVLIFSFPVTAWAFKKISLISIISNIIFIPVVTLLLNCLFIFNSFVIFNINKIIYTPLIFICKELTKIVINTSNLLAKIPFAMISLNYGFINLCLAFSIILIALSLLFENYKKSIKISLLLSFIIHSAGFISYIFLNKDFIRVTILNCSDGIGFGVSKNLRVSAFVGMEEKFNCLSLNEYLFKHENNIFDYLSIISYKNKDYDYIQNLSEMYNPNLVAIPENLKYKLKNTEKVCFKNNISSQIWENINSEIFEINNYIFASIKIYNLTFFLCINGGDAKDIPEKYKKCDFLVINKLPLNYKEIKSKNIIVSANKNDSEIFINKLSNTNSRTFSTYHNGNFYVDIDKNKYLTRRFQ